MVARVMPVVVWVLAGVAWAQIDATRMREADELIGQAISRGDIPGAVLLVGRGKQDVYLKAYGNRSVEPQKVAMTTDTVFDLASLSKPVGCATSIMLLAERGKIDLWEPVSKYLPAFAANGKERITIAQLLLHTGGLVPDNPLSDYQNGVSVTWERINALRPLWEPGTRFAYTDVGYIVLGELVRVVDGRSLDQFARQEIFEPLGMADTAYNPGPPLKARCAPTYRREGRWMVGEVHDPRAYLLGGVAGHAGLFSTAEDLARYCRMLLADGRAGDKRVLAARTVREMIEPRMLADGVTWRTYGWDVQSGYASARGDRFQVGSTFGHTGFTGTMIWIDPGNDCFVIFLTNRVHPADKGEVIALRRAVTTLAAEALLGPRPRAGASVKAALDWAIPLGPTTGRPATVLCGIDVLKRDGFKLLEGRRIALMTNHTGRDRDGNRTVDLLLAAKNVQVVKLFSPEHGFYGTLDEKVGDTVDPRTGMKVYSLYGETRRPTDEMMQGVDTVVFDIQDVGARFYTYSASLGYCMEAAARHKCRMIVLDRPNPITGLVVDGPIADRESFGFTAYGPMPVSHGMTFGELARLYNQEWGVNCDLVVVGMEGWRRSMWFDETGLTWINPSPNMRNLTQAALYTGVCLLEASNVSVGRGTDQPFEVFGAPWIDGKKLAAALNGENLPGLRFVPIEFTPASSKHASKPCHGVYIIVTDRNALEPVRAGVAMAWHLRRLFPDSFQFDLVGRLLQNRAALAAIAAAKNPDAVPAVWKDAVQQFIAVREKYLLYR